MSQPQENAVEVSCPCGAFMALRGEYATSRRMGAAAEVLLARFFETHGHSAHTNIADPLAPERYIGGE